MNSVDEERKERKERRRGTGRGEEKRYRERGGEERAGGSPDATTVLAHRVFSMLRLSWIDGSQSSCRGSKTTSLSAQ